MNIVVWIERMGNNDLDLLSPAAKVLEELYGKVQLLCFVASENIPAKNSPTINKNKLKKLQKWPYDLVLVTGKDTDFEKVIEEAGAAGLKTNRFVPDHVILLPGFTLEKYKQLRRSKLSIFSMNDFGSLIYQNFSLPILSPTIDMHTSETDFIKFLQNPKENVNNNNLVENTENVNSNDLVGNSIEDVLNFINDLSNSLSKRVYQMGGIEWEMNEHSDFETVVNQQWIERARKINWDNLLIAMHTESPEILAEFDKLPFAKKVCFVPFETNLDSGYFVNFHQISGIPDLGSAVNGIASGVLPLFDMWDMLLYGKKTPLT